MAYTIVIERSVLKYLKTLEHSVVEKLWQKIAGLKENPRPNGYLKLKGQEAYRVRVGDYRVIYEIADERLLITVIHAGHRRDVYE